jgi:hypothetical protein
MKNKSTLNDDVNDNLTPEELQEIALKPETLKMIENLVNDNPHFKNIENLASDKEFQEKLRERMTNNFSASIKDASANLSNNTALITDKDYKHALTTYKNPHAYIQQLEENFFEQLEFNPDNGTMNIKGNLLEPITLQNIKTRSNLKELDLPLLRSLYTTIYCYADKIDTDTVRIYLPTLAEHLGVNIRGDKPYELFSKIKAFDSVIGVFDNGSFYRMLTFLGYNKQTNSVTFGSPYINRILRALQEANTITPKKGEPYLNPHHSYLIHGTIANERNKPAIEIVNAIVTLLHQRGVDKPPKEVFTLSELKRTIKQTIREEFGGADEKNNDEEQPAITTMHKKISSIIEEIPLLTEALEKPAVDKKTNLLKPKPAKDKNKTLERAFSGAYSLLKTKTDIYKYYKNLKITEIIPTISTIDQIIEISHNGINEEYQKT